MLRKERSIYFFLCTTAIVGCSNPGWELPSEILERGDLGFFEEHEHEEYEDFAIGLGATEIRQGLAHPGRWTLPAELEPISDGQYVSYDGAPPYNGGANCASGATPGARTLRDHLLGYFPQISGIGVYNCRVISGTNKMSLHGMGRALDIMIPTTGGDADNDAGDPIAHFLIENAEAIGVQQIIWDHSIWRAYATPRHKVLNSSNPHIDHLHVEINEQGGAEATPWFDAPQGPAPCDTLVGTSGLVDNGHDCLKLFGPAQYWRNESGVGQGGSLRWTNAYDGNRASNWAQWSLPLQIDGYYQIEVYLDDAFAIFDRTRYEVRANGATFPVVLNQAQSSGWTSLGTFHFAADGSENVAVYDNAPGPVASNQHIAVDALRYSRVDSPSPPEPTTPESPSGCAALPPVGGIIEETGPCFEMFGPSQYWRSVGDAGHGNHLLWTNAFQNDSPNNWAHWRLPLQESGDYQIRIYLDPAHAQFFSTRYELKRADATRVLTVDQSVANGWYSLGTFSFDANEENTLVVFDHAAVPVGTERRIAVDSIQLVRLTSSMSAPDAGEDESTVGDSASTEEEGGAVSGRVRYPELRCTGLRCDFDADNEQPAWNVDDFDEGYDADEDDVRDLDATDAGMACTQSGALPTWVIWLGIGFAIRRRRKVSMIM